MKIGIIICDRYRDCAGGKCFRAVRERKGGFSHYSQEEPLEVVGFTTCGGCPGGNIEYSPEEMVKNGAEAIHLATGFVVGYPPCPSIDYFKDFIETRYGIPVVVGTHPIPEKYLTCHRDLPSLAVLEGVEQLMATEEVRLAYD
jgi:predicted metal-binding protein